MIEWAICSWFPYWISWFSMLCQFTRGYYLWGRNIPTKYSPKYGTVTGSGNSHWNIWNSWRKNMLGFFVQQIEYMNRWHYMIFHWFPIQWLGGSEGARGIHIPHIFPIYYPYIPHIFPIYSPYITHIFPIYSPYIPCSMGSQLELRIEFPKDPLVSKHFPSLISRIVLSKRWSNVPCQWPWPRKRLIGGTYHI